MAKFFRCRLVLGISPVNPSLRAEKLFDDTYEESTESPIDEFLVRLQTIMKLAPQPENFDPLQGQLILLGVIAAVESYFRTIMRRLIVMDLECQSCVHEREVAYGAAIHLAKNMLPEAMLERISFISSESIKSAIKELLAVKGNLPAELLTAINDYVQVCQLRHCAVHRFGKLGVKNAIALGLVRHKKLLEKPLKLDYTALQDTIAISTGLVKTVNNFLFNEMLSRISRSEWTTQYAKDKRRFLAYYKLFSDAVSTNASPPAKEVYLNFIEQMRAFDAAN